MRSDRVTLTVPAKSEYARTVRLLAAELAGRMGMTYDEVDDVRIAAEEAFVFACARVPYGDDVAFTFAIEGPTLAVSVGPVPNVAGAAEEEGEPLDRYALFILESVCDSTELDEGPGSCTLRVTKHKTTEV